MKLLTFSHRKSLYIEIIDLKSFMQKHLSFLEEQEERLIALPPASPPLIT